MDTKSKSRTGNNRLTKKVGVPHWVIAVVLLIVAITGGFLVYSSFAANSSVAESGPRVRVNGADVYCNRGYCRLAIGQGNQFGKDCYRTTAKPVRYTCRS